MATATIGHNVPPDPFEAVREFISYDPESGALTWIKGRSNVRAGTSAGTRTDERGYLVVIFKRRRFYAHRLAWFLSNGEWPAGDIDHINGNPGDNRLANLRLASRSQNCMNTRSRGGSSRFRGVSFHKQRGRWRAFLNTQHIGLFDSEEDAARAHDAAALAARGEFARLNFPAEVANG